MTRVTIADVAVAAGVSTTAVSFAFNYPERLGQPTLDRVLQVAHELGYAPHPAARALSMRRIGAIGMLIPQRLSTVFANPFTAELVQGVGEFCEQHNLALLLVPPVDGSLEGAIRRAAVDGFISLGLTPDDPALRMLDQLGIPSVLVDSDADAGHPAVNVDDASGAREAARHVLELGHRRIALVLLPPVRAHAGPTPVAARRLAGYRSALEAVGGLAEPFTVTAGATVEAGGRAFASLPTGRQRPTAVLCMSDTVAIGLIVAALEAGLRLPEDLSVVGYDDVAMAAWTTPPLTTVRQPIVEKGRVAARLLVTMLQGRAVASPPPLETTLIIRGSTAEPPGGGNRQR